MVNVVSAALLVFASVLTASVLTTSATYIWPNYVMDELEHLLVDNGGFNDAGVLKAITPCTNYVSGPQTAGRITAAEWIRVLFHDFVTANVSAGTGGLDASIAFETNRTENAGLYANNTLAFFSPYLNKYVSMADLIALGSVMSSSICSKPLLRPMLRGGRIDATQAGPAGVPQPGTNITATLASFAGAGFNQSDAIMITGCTHSMGSVHFSESPRIVPASSVTPNNTDGAVPFDSTASIYDTKVLTEYLNSTGQQGGPLVTSTNVAVRSDLRLYNSDNNATVKYLSSASNFASACSEIITRAIDTVPSTVTLTDVIVPQVVKPVGVSVNVDCDGWLLFSGYIRLLSSEWSKNSFVFLSWTSRNGSNFDYASTEAVLAEYGTGSYGQTFYYHFSISINPQEGISNFKITVTDGWRTVKYENGGKGYPMEDTVVWMQDETIAWPTGASVSAAVLTSVNPKTVNAVLAIPSPVNGSLSPNITTSTITLAASGTLGLYTVYTGMAYVSLMNIPQTSVDIVAITPDNVALMSEFNKLK